MDYYKQKQFIAKVDKKDRILGKIERCGAHKKGTLHRGFTAILIYKDNFIIQHRKHPAFDGYFDLSFSSHQIYTQNKLQTDLEAIYDSLKREWNLEKKDLIYEPKFKGKIYYKAKDPNSVFTEHEIDYIYEVKLNKLPKPNLDFAYGYKLVSKLEVDNWKLEINLAPWVKKILQEMLEDYFDEQDAIKLEKEPKGKAIPIEEVMKDCA